MPPANSATRIPRSSRRSSSSTTSRGPTSTWQLSAGRSSCRRASTARSTRWSRPVPPRSTTATGSAGPVASRSTNRARYASLVPMNPRKSTLTDRLTLAATNGLGSDQVGRVHLGIGEGVTGLAAAERRPVQVPDVRVDPHFKWIPGFDVAGLTSMLSVPLTWDDRLVGVLNVQTAEPRTFATEDVGFLQTIAALLAGIVEKGRVQAEAE